MELYGKALWICSAVDTDAQSRKFCHPGKDKEATACRRQG